MFAGVAPGLLIAALFVVFLLVSVLVCKHLRSKSDAEEFWDDLCDDYPSVFLSHHKGGCGDVARLVKMQMNIAGAIQIFLDSGLANSTCMCTIQMTSAPLGV